MSVARRINEQPNCRDVLLLQVGVDEGLAKKAFYIFKLITAIPDEPGLTYRFPVFNETVGRFP